MDKKVNLNNTQRKMLDDIYMERFDEKVKIIKKQREDGFQKLKKEILKKESKNRDVKNLLDNIKKVATSFNKVKEYLKERDLAIDGFSYDAFDREKKLKFYDGYYREYREHPDLRAYQVETEEIQDDLAKRKKEIRARIYGMDTSYDEVDREIKPFLDSIKI